MTAHDELQRWWEESAGKVATECVDEARLAGLESRYAVRLPSDFREYLSRCAPVGEAGLDDQRGTEWWSFGRIKSVRDDFDGHLEPLLAVRAHEWLLFADYAAWIWAWAIDCSAGADRGKIAIVGGKGYNVFVAESFSDFVTKYVADFYSVC